MQEARMNIKKLATNNYPGRGIVLGKSADGTQIIQVYWIMGRSENSRNRVFAREEDTVKTIPFDASKVEDPSLIIYNAMRRTGYADMVYDVVSNGKHTDDIIEQLANGNTFEHAVAEQEYEPDEPNYTPRISGLAIVKASHAFLGIVRRNPATGKSQPVSFTKPLSNGLGWCLHTYEIDGNPIPSFLGEPYTVPLDNDIETIANTYWHALNQENRIAIVAKGIDAKTGKTTYCIINKLS